MPKYISRAAVAAGALVPSVAKRRKHLGHGIVDQDVAVRQEQDLRSAMFAGPVPAAAPQLPADLECNTGLARAGRECRQHALLAEQNRFDDARDGDLLVVAGHLARDEIEGLKQMGRGGLRNRGSSGEALP
jgi:hypothetical protein